jgi:S-adenosylmethionine-diacylglycerol 3-amino-3-carboxypropyl transferase
MVIRERFLSNKYFTKLNYTLSNEDTFFENELLPSHLNNIISICGSGSRVIPLLAKNPKEITIVDSSEWQLKLCELRIETIRTLSYEEFLIFWGYRKTAEEDAIRLRMRFMAKSELKNIFIENNWSAPIYYGKWEQTVIKLSKIMNILLGKNNIEKLFSFTTKNEYDHFLDKVFPWNRFNLFVTILTHPFIMNILLYKGNHAKFKTNENITLGEYYTQFFKKVIEQDLARKNFFLQLSLLGEIRFEDGLPAEATKDIFELVKKNSDQIKVNYFSGDFFTAIKNSSNNFDFVSLSDVPSYFSSEIENKHLQLIKEKLSDGAIVCCRYYLNCLSDIDTSGFTNINSEQKHNIEKEKTPFYRFDIWKKNIKSSI